MYKYNDILSELCIFFVLSISQKKSIELIE